MLALSMVLNFSGEISVSLSSLRRAAGSAIKVPGEAPTGGRRVFNGARFLSLSAMYPSTPSARQPESRTETNA